MLWSRTAIFYLHAAGKRYVYGDCLQSGFLKSLKLLKNLQRSILAQLFVTSHPRKKTWVFPVSADSFVILLLCLLLLAMFL